MTRDQKIKALKNDYATNYAGCNYPQTFEPLGYLTQCNFGGLQIILSNCGGGCLVWQDWSDTAVDTELTECEIDCKENEDTGEIEPFFIHQNCEYFLSEFLRP